RPSSQDRRTAAAQLSLRDAGSPYPCQCVPDVLSPWCRRRAQLRLGGSANYRHVAGHQTPWMSVAAEQDAAHLIVARRNLANPEDAYPPAVLAIKLHRAASIEVRGFDADLKGSIFSCRLDPHLDIEIRWLERHLRRHIHLDRFVSGGGTH